MMFYVLRKFLSFLPPPHRLLKQLNFSDVSASFRRSPSTLQLRISNQLPMILIVRKILDENSFSASTHVFSFGLSKFLHPFPTDVSTPSSSTFCFRYGAFSPFQPLHRLRLLLFFADVVVPSSSTTTVSATQSSNFLRHVDDISYISDDVSTVFSWKLPMISHFKIFQNLFLSSSHNSCVAYSIN